MGVSGFIVLGFPQKQSPEHPVQKFIPRVTSEKVQKRGREGRCIINVNDQICAVDNWGLVPMREAPRILGESESGLSEMSQAQEDKYSMLSPMGKLLSMGIHMRYLSMYLVRRRRRGGIS